MHPGSGLTRYDASYLGVSSAVSGAATLAVAEARDRGLGADGELVSLWHAADRECRRRAGEAGNPGAPETSPGERLSGWRGSTELVLSPLVRSPGPGVL
jgi:hypothetical protein